MGPRLVLVWRQSAEANQRQRNEFFYIRKLLFRSTNSWSACKCDDDKRHREGIERLSANAWHVIWFAPIVCCRLAKNERFMIQSGFSARKGALFSRTSPLCVFAVNVFFAWSCLPFGRAICTACNREKLDPFFPKRCQNKNYSFILACRLSQPNVDRVRRFRSHGRHSAPRWCFSTRPLFFHIVLAWHS